MLVLEMQLLLYHVVQRWIKVLSAFPHIIHTDEQNMVIVCPILT